MCAHNYEFGIRVPLAVRWPKKCEVTDFINLADIVPTGQAIVTN